MKLKLNWLCALMLAATQLQAATINYADVMNSVSKHYPLILAAQLAINKAQAAEYAARGAFDPSLNSHFLSTLAGTYKNRNLDVEYQIPTFANGGYVFTGYRYGQGDYPVYNQGYLTENKGEVRTGITIPLLRGRQTDKNRTSLLVSKTNIKVEQQRLRLALIDTKLEASFAYWRWRGEKLKLELVKQLLVLAKERQQAIEKRYQHGDAAKIEVVENNRFINQRQAALIAAERSLQKAAFYLSLYYRDANGKPILPSTQLPAQALPSVSANKQMLIFFKTHALSLISNHPLQIIYNYDRKILNDQLHLVDNERLPALDMKVYYAQDMGHNTTQMPIAEKSLNLALDFNLPVYQRRARGETEKIRQSLLELTEKQTLAHDQLLIQLYDAINQLKADQREALLTQNEVTLSYNVERAELKRFINGDSSLFLVNQREQATFDAKVRAINATVNYFFSQSRLAAFCADEPHCLAQLQVLPMALAKP